MLGVPLTDRGPLRDYSLEILGALDLDTPPPVTISGNRAVLEFSEYLPDLIDDRRHNPSHYADDVMGRLIDGSVEGDRLSDHELIQNRIFILNAGMRRRPTRSATASRRYLNTQPNWPACSKIQD